MRISQVKKRGLSLLIGSGNDAVSVTNLTASGANIVLFTTGNGNPFGAFVPTIKISSNTALAEKKTGWIDFNAGGVLEGKSFEEVVAETEKYIKGQQTFFVLETLETLRKNGRLSKVKALVASALKIKPVMGSTEEGAIYQLDQARGINKALVKMAQAIVEKTADSEQKVLAISHCNCHERAILLKNALEERMPMKKIVILDTAGVSSMYANDGGVIVAV